MASCKVSSILLSLTYCNDRRCGVIFFCFDRGSLWHSWHRFCKSRQVIPTQFNLQPVGRHLHKERLLRKEECNVILICLVEYETRADFGLRRYLRKSSWRGTKRILEAECCWSGTSCGIFNRYKGVTFQITSLSSLQLEEQGRCSSHSGIFCVVRNSDSNDYWKFLL